MGRWKHCQLAGLDMGYNLKNHFGADVQSKPDFRPFPAQSTTRRFLPEPTPLISISVQYQEAQDSPLPLPEGCRPQVPPQPPSRPARHHEGPGTLNRWRRSPDPNRPITSTTGTNKWNRRSATRASVRSHKCGRNEMKIWMSNTSAQGLGQNNMR